MTDRQRYCGECITFDPIHQCCRTRIDETNTYLAKASASAACADFGTPTLPAFLQTKQDQA